jgi:hypothetical protein
MRVCCALIRLWLAHGEQQSKTQQVDQFYKFNLMCELSQALLALLCRIHRLVHFSVPRTLQLKNWGDKLHDPSSSSYNSNCLAMPMQNDFLPFPIPL